MAATNYTGADPVTHNPTYNNAAPTYAYTLYQYDQPVTGATDRWIDRVALSNVAVTTETEYDGFGRPDLLRVYNGSLPIYTQDFDYCADGQKKEVVERHYTSSSTFSEAKITWTYDGQNRLASELRDEGNNGVDPADYNHTYAYDSAGNRITKTIDVGNNGGTPEEVLTSTYDNNDRLSSVDSNTNNANDATYGYDANGSQTSATVGGTPRQYLWDLRNRLVGYDANNDGDALDVNDANFTYDTRGVRTKSVLRGTPSNTTTYFVQDTNNPTGYSQVAEERPAAGATAAATRSFIVGRDVIAQANGGTVRHLMYDAGGSTRALLLSGAVDGAQVYAYDAFGARIATASASLGTVPTTPLLYRGEYLDPILGQYQLRARYYNPTTGRFTSFDRFESLPGKPSHAHKYNYAGADPIDGIDPSGYDFWSTVGQLAVNGIKMLLQSMFLPTLSVKTFATRVAFGLASYAYNQVRMYHYDAPLAQSLERLASVIQPINAVWAGRISAIAQRTAASLTDNTILSYATSFYIPQFAGSHVGHLLTGVMGANAYLKHLEAEATAMAFVKEWSGLDIKIDIDAMDAAWKYLSLQLDPAGDIDLFADAIMAAREGDITGSARLIGRLIKSLLDQYEVTVSGSYHGQLVDVQFSVNL